MAEFVHCSSEQLAAEQAAHAATRAERDLLRGILSDAFWQAAERAKAEEAEACRRCGCAVTDHPLSSIAETLNGP